MRAYSYLMNASDGDTGHYVELQEMKFLELLKCLLSRVEVDEAWYRASNQDVDQAIRAGQLESGRHHYIIAGYFENRFPRPIVVDEPWYLAEYPDVAGAIETGAFASASEHFARDGFKEGRLPSRDWSLLGSAKPVLLKAA
jgi:hypothetical protein